jgi:imidazoleglycerol phosphate synthase glutamine amidotransferase subunit HisH
MEVTLIDSPVANVANIARALREVGASLHVTRDPDAIGRAPRIVLPGVGAFTAAMRWLEETRIDASIRDAVSRGAALLGICVGHQVLFEVSYEMAVTRGLGLVTGEVRMFEGALPVPQIGWNCVQTAGENGPTSTERTREAERTLSTERTRSTGSQPVSENDRLRAGAPSPFENDRLRAGAPSPFESDRLRAGAPSSFESPLFDGIASGTSFYFVNSYAASNVPHEIARADYGGAFTAAVQNGRVFGVQFHPEKSSTAGLRVLRNFVEKVQ